MLYRFEVDKKCNRCTLSCKEGTISGQSEVPFSDVKLIVVSAYPSNREYKTNLSLAPSSSDKQEIPNSNKSPVGAGEFLRFCMKIIDRNLPQEYRPIEDFTYFTNAIKCTPQHGKDKITVTERHIKTCRDSWLLKEIDMFPSRVPIFACASEAVKALLGTKESLYNNRNRVNYYKKHPIIVSTNPIDWEKYVMKYVPDIEESRQYVTKLMKTPSFNKHKKKIDEVIGVKKWEALPGSPLYFVKQDFKLVTQEIIKYINS